jgi:hypothetical protein
MSRNASLTQAEFDRILDTFKEMEIYNPQKFMNSGFLAKLLRYQPLTMYELLEFGLQKPVLKEPWRWGDEMIRPEPDWSR